MVARVFPGATGVEERARVDLELSVGPVEARGDGVDVCFRIETGVDSSNTFVTDDSGLQAKIRVNAQSADAPVPNAYFPAVSTAYVSGGGVGVGLALPYSQGVGSPGNGDLEVMVHRRLLQNGWPPAGLGQPLNETTRVNPKMNLILFEADARGGSGDWTRTFRTYKNNYPVALFFGDTVSEAKASENGGSLIASVSGLQTPLPPFAHLLTFKSRAGGKDAIMVRFVRVNGTGGVQEWKTSDVETGVCVDDPEHVFTHSSDDEYAFEERSLTMTKPLADVVRWSWPRGLGEHQHDIANGPRTRTPTPTPTPTSSGKVCLAPLQIRSFLMTATNGTMQK